MKQTTFSLSLIVISLILVVKSYAAVDPESIMGMWLFDEGDGDVAIDSSENGNDGNLTNGPEWVDDGKINGGMYFDGSDDIVKVPMVVDYDEMSVVVWFKDQGSPVRPRIVSNEHTDVSLTGFQLEYDTSGSGSFFDIGTGARAAAIFNFKADADTWYHYAGTYDGNNIRAYINGEVMAEGTGSGSIKETGIDVHIGMSTYGGDQFKGILDEVAIFNKGLSQEDIQDIMENGLEEATGLAAVSSSGKLATSWGKIKNFK